MKLNTLNTIIDDILLQARNSTISESEHLSRLQIEQWVHNYRAFLIKQDLDKGRDINPMYIQTIPNVKLNRIETVPGNRQFVSEIRLPKLIDLHFRKGLVNVKDMFGNIIEYGDETKAKYHKYKRYTNDDYIAYLKGDRVYLQGKFNLLDRISLDILAENPADCVSCFNPDEPYPIPANMVPTIKDLIFSKELNVMRQMTTDTVNDSVDQTQNSQTSK